MPDNMKEELKGVHVRDLNTEESEDHKLQEALKEKDHTIARLKEKIESLEAHARFLEKEQQKQASTPKRKPRVEINREAEDRIEKAKDAALMDKKYNKQ